jgi:radical SAM protein with 4Fe4S-binding SPASM domain
MLLSEENPIIKMKKWAENDLSLFRNTFNVPEPISVGIYTYKITTKDDWEKRIHLRVEPDGAGKLFVDVTEVIHLNQIAVKIVKFALDKVPKEYAVKMMSQQYIGQAQRQKEDVERLYSMVEHLLSGDDGCQTCALTGLLTTAPLFSLPANAPYKIDVALTYGCNNQCPHCYNESGRLLMPSLPFEKWKIVFQKIDEIGIPHVILTGGEATLHPNFLEIIRYADQLGMVVGLNSNGRYLGHRPFMKQVAEAGLNHVQITLGSNIADVHDRMMGAKSFHQTVQGIISAIDSGVHVITNTTLIRSNTDHVEELIDFIYDLGIRTFAMNGMIYSGGGFENPEAIHEQDLLPLLAWIKQYAESKGMRFLWYTPTEYCRFSPFEIDIGVKRCNAGEYSICIEPNGDVLPCQSYYVPAGNLIEDSWQSIWESELFKSFREREDDPAGSDLPGKCLGCPEFSVCGGGCRIEREAQAGTRVAEVAGGGCIGCTGFSGDQEAVKGQDRHIRDYNAEEGAYIPLESLVSRTRRSTGAIKISESNSSPKGELG